MAQSYKPNPFTPSFGEIPLVLAGRDRLLGEIASALSRPNRSPELTMLIAGARGTGKTALLAKAAERAQQSGWIAVKAVASPGMLEDIYQHAVRDSAHITAKPDGARRLTGLGLGQALSLEWHVDAPEPGNWRMRMEGLLDQVEETGAGLFIAVDEIDPAIDEMVQLASVYQLMVMDGRRVALMMAGLPHNIEKAKGDRRISFIRRAQQRRLGRVADEDVRRAIEQTVRQGEREIDPEAVEVATQAAEGFPFMIQLVGYRMWEESPTDAPISPADAKAGAEAAAREMDSYILESTYRDLSDGDIAFLAAMLEDEGGSSLKDIGRRLGKPSGHVGTYKERLLKAGVIDETDRNAVGFSLPGFKRFLANRLGRQA